MARAKPSSRKASGARKPKPTAAKKKTSSPQAPKRPAKAAKRPAKAKKLVGTPKAAPPKRNPNMGRLIAPKAAPGEVKLPPGAALADDPVATEIVRILREVLTPSTLSVQNTSHAHRKHKSARAHGGGHYSLFVVSELFHGLNPIQRQQWIYGLLGDLLANKKIHALEMKLKGPDETSSI